MLWIIGEYSDKIADTESILFESLETFMDDPVEAIPHCLYIYIIYKIYYIPFVLSDLDPSPESASPSLAP